MKINIYTASACNGNPGPGGWAAILEGNGYKKEICGGVRLTTNIRMALRAVVEALKCLRTYHIELTVYSNCQSVVLPMTGGKVHEKLAKGKQSNADLWKDILSFTHNIDSVTFVELQSYNTSPEYLRCHELAVRKANACPQEVDKPYENAGDSELANIVTQGLDSVDGKTFIQYLRKQGYEIVKIN